MPRTLFYALPVQVRLYSRSLSKNARSKTPVGAGRSFGFEFQGIRPFP